MTPESNLTDGSTGPVLRSYPLSRRERVPEGRVRGSGIENETALDVSASRPVQKSESIHLRHRRDFVRTIALGASAASLTTPACRGAEAPPEVGPPKPEPEAISSEVEARMGLVLSRFGKLLDADARKAVEARVTAIVRRAEALRKIELDNGDGPASVFTPYRAPLAGEGAS